MSLSIVLEPELALCVIEYAAILDLELKSQDDGYKTKFQKAIDSNSNETIKDVIFESSGHFLKDFSGKAFEPSFNLYLQIFSLLNKESGDVEKNLLKVLEEEFKDIEASSISSSSLISALTNLFNLLPETSVGRYTALDLITNLIIKDFPTSISSITYGLKEWLLQISGLKIEQTSDLIQKVAIAYLKQEETEAFNFTKDILSQFEITPEAFDALIIEIINYKSYNNIESIEVRSKNAEIVKLIDIYTKFDYKLFKSELPSLKSSLPAVNFEQLDSRLQSLSLINFFVTSDDNVFTYKQLADQVSVDESDVEMALFPLLSQGLIKGKFSQLTSTFTINQLSPQVVSKKGESVWAELDGQLNSWAENLSQLDTFVDELVNNAYKKKKTPAVIQRFHLAKQEAK